MSAEQHRLRFHAWLVAAGLDEETADVILMTMAPFPWHELATKAELAELRVEMRGQFENVRNEFGSVRDEMAGTRTEMRNQFGDIRTELSGTRTEMRDQFGDIRTEMAGIRTDVRTMVFALVGFMLTIILAGAATAISFAL